MFGGGYASAPPAPPMPVRHRSTARQKKISRSGQTVER
jgi:hypothetical protein